MKTLAGIVLLATAGFGGTFNVLSTGMNSTTPGDFATPGGLDPHYTSGSGPVYVLTVVNRNWLGSDSLSQWIGPDPIDGGQYAGALYNLDYQVSFDLTGLDPATASISGYWSTDNYGHNILINGTSTGQTTGLTLFDYENFFYFSISSGFRPGINTLDFLWENSGGPGGLRVEFNSGTADPAPEPGTFVLLGIAIAGAGLRRRLARG